MGTTLIEDPGSPRKKQGTTLAEPVGGTRLAEPAGNSSDKAAASSESEGKAADHPQVVGWLVLINGPGKGRSLELGYGMNIVGRAGTNRVSLDYGDDQISGEDHFRIAYDGAKRQFHLVPGKGTNLVYVGDDPLLAPVALTDGQELEVGQTRLKFVALCGPEWDWGD